MAPKRPSLFGSAAPKASAEPEAATEDQAPPPPAPDDAPVPTVPARGSAPPVPAESAQTGRYPKAKTREGKRVATVYLEREAHRQLQKIVFDEETTIQDLLVEGINAVFERRNLSRIA